MVSYPEKSKGGSQTPPPQLSDTATSQLQCFIISQVYTSRGVTNIHSRLCHFRETLQMEIFYRLMSGLHIASRNCSKPMELLAELFVETLQIEPLTGDRSHVIRQELLHSHEVAGRTLHDASQVPQLCHTSVGSHLPFLSQKCTSNYRKKQKSREKT